MSYLIYTYLIFNIFSTDHSWCIYRTLSIRAVQDTSCVNVTANLIWRRRVSVCHLFSVHWQDERQTSISINRSHPDILSQASRANMLDFSGANNRAPTLRYRRSSMTLPVLYFASPPPGPDVVPSEFTAPR